jgi:hypothetical protein
MAQKRKWEDVITQTIRAGKKFKVWYEGDQKNSIIFFVLLSLLKNSFPTQNIQSDSD